MLLYILVEWIAQFFFKKLKKIKSRSFHYELEKAITINKGFVFNSWSLIYSFGIILLHLISRNYARSISDSQLEGSADNFLIRACVDAISQKQYSTATEILEYASKLKLSSDPISWMVDINLAQVYKWTKEQEKFDAVIESRNWKELSAKYGICAAALNEDLDEIENLMPIIKTQKQVSFIELCDWPIFQSVRDTDRFKKLVLDNYGKSIDENKDIIRPMVIDANYVETMSRINDVYKEVKKKS